MNEWVDTLLNHSVCLDKILRVSQVWQKPLGNARSQPGLKFPVTERAKKRVRMQQRSFITPADKTDNGLIKKALILPQQRHGIGKTWVWSVQNRTGRDSQRTQYHGDRSSISLLTVGFWATCGPHRWQNAWGSCGPPSHSLLSYIKYKALNPCAPLLFIRIYIFSSLSIQHSLNLVFRPHPQWPGSSEFTCKHHKTD